MDDRNATHRRLSTILRHVKKSITAMDVKLWQQPALGKREEAAAQENPKDLKLPVSPSREFVSRALVSSRKQVKQYERLSPLVPQTRALGSYSHVRKGDCVVAFSRCDIYSIKKEIESSCKHNCSVVYGSLPPKTRTKQAALFNDVVSGSDILVASDVVGMGLNLNIRRIIFSTLEYFDGTSMRALTVAEIKQNCRLNRQIWIQVSRGCYNMFGQRGSSIASPLPRSSDMPP
ncbi:hypothetical protein BDL97_03G131400 [Sphagnum fallax]|nr:hypothetical protein BDL97_03G131400 [Sphagnum fallax]KAH8968510.1 hypothetical protein BDL97_03G131400 [Sphagnum fallax]KAH8968511.1 hypothetical protein BDL97_03G131400 [Sphagnum fallax]